MKINSELPLTLFYKKVTPQKGRVKRDPIFTQTVNEIAGIDVQEISGEPLVNISIESITVHDTNTLKDAIEEILKVSKVNEQLLPQTSNVFIEQEIGAQLLWYLAKTKGLQLDEPKPIDRLVKSFEHLL